MYIYIYIYIYIYKERKMHENMQKVTSVLKKPERRQPKLQVNKDDLKALMENQISDKKSFDVLIWTLWNYLWVIGKK